jgi:hypothetical protein
LETAVRAFTLRTTRADAEGEDDDPKPPGRRGRWRPRWREVIVWDMETVTTPDQRLYVIEDGHPPRRLEEDLSYPDDLEAPDAFPGATRPDVPEFVPGWALTRTRLQRQRGPTHPTPIGR